MALLQQQLLAAVELDVVNSTGAHRHKYGM